MSTQTEDVRAGLPSASSMDRVWHCPGSVAAERGMPELPKQSITQSGTDIHAALAGGDDELELSDAEIKERITKIQNAAFIAWVNEFQLEPVSKDVHREERLWVRDRSTLDPIASAQLDVFYVVGTHAIAIDFKTGYADTTPSERNWQIRCQVIALWHEYPQLTHIRGAILASRLSDKFDATDFDLGELQSAERELRHTLWRATWTDAPRVPGSWCRYCRASGVCKEAAVYAMAFSAIVPKVVGPLSVIEAVAKMAPVELAYVHGRSTLANAIFDAVEARLKALPEEELRKVGYYLAEGVRITRFTNVTAAMARLLNIMTPEERAECISISIPKAAKAVAASKGIPKEKARALTEETLGDSFTTTTGNPRLKAL